MKKIICFTMCTVMLFTLAACGAKQAAPAAENAAHSATEETAVSSSEPMPDAEGTSESNSQDVPDRAEDTAIIEEDHGGQNPVMNFVGEYQCDRAHALVECDGYEDARITIEWAGSVAEFARWDISGRFDTETLTIEYSGCTKSHVVYNENGEVASQEPEYEDGTGTITFHDDGTFTWHEDQSEDGTDMVFEWLPVD